MSADPTATAAGCTDEHAKFCSQCTTARLYNTIHCQDCGEGRPSAATTEAATTTAAAESPKMAAYDKGAADALRSLAESFAEAGMPLAAEITFKALAAVEEGKHR